MRAWVKLGLFLSSYLPLFLIFAIRNWPNSLANFILGFVVIYSSVWAAIIWLTKKTTLDSYKVLKADNKAKDALSYLIPYIISFISFDLTKWQDISSIFILLAILFVVSMHSELIYINPVLYFLKYRVYDVEVCKPYLGCENSINKIILITKREIKKDTNISVRDLEGNIMIEVVK